MTSYAPVPSFSVVALLTVPPGTAATAAAYALERVSPSDLDLWIVPDLNPDGVAACTRQNAYGVDLNRNFPWRWRPMGGVYESGRRPLSEREARIAHALILRLRPRLTVWFHQHLDMVWASGGQRRIERVFARVSGLPYHPSFGVSIRGPWHSRPIGNTESTRRER
jgi:Zinc carboxypeptidase